jgi:glycosyltransferase involved in cell wall biosynthesis
MKNPRISIIIPAYNAEEYIFNAINCALNQTFSDIEVIVVNDGSTDQTEHIVNRFDDSRLHMICQVNMGQSAAINKGVECAKGTYIKLLDADDWINPNHVEAQLLAITGSQNMLASCRWGHFVDDFTKPAVRQEVTNKSYDDPMAWLIDSLTKDEGMMGGCMWLIPKSLWEKAGGFDPRLSLNNDFHFSVKLVLASEGIRFAKEAVYSYRKGLSGALSAGNSRKSMESAFLTTKLGTGLLLERENSERIRRICADRFQSWLYRFYPFHADLVSATEKRINELGGSDLELQGGQLLRLMAPLIGWKGVRRLQWLAYQYGWGKVLKKKAVKRLRQLD